MPAILKSWLIVPLFVTLNVVTPLAIVFFESVNLNSLGLPAVTVTVVADCGARAAEGRDRGDERRERDQDDEHRPLPKLAQETLLV